MISYYNNIILGAEALRDGYFGPGNGSVTVALHNVRCKPDVDMTILECCKGRIARPGCCIEHRPAAVRCSRDDQFIRNVSVTLITDGTPTTSI